ncbi:hypothetical protein D915_009183 [Fasciola hepatica]|uniref:Uncharacterized protein n=1 Tax=Fasciola hepatica TaxID=6192 RepID=A0A4E0RT28_FASHE|nr:hypothetical protein D915_009183 [Fasciola hepatica]
MLLISQAEDTTTKRIGRHLCLAPKMKSKRKIRIPGTVKITLQLMTWDITRTLCMKNVFLNSVSSTNEISELYASRRNSNYEHISNEAKDSKITRTTNNADSEIDSLIEAAKARAQRREIAKSERQTATNGSIIRGRSTRNGSYGVLQAPWHTEFSDGNDKSHVNGNENTLSLKTMQLKQKTTSQADFPEYSTQELKESKLPPRRAEYKESVPWYPGSNGMNVTEDQLCLYKRSSDVIGESYVDTFGDNCRRQKTFKEKVADVAPVAASSLRSTPYAQHN